MDKKEFLTQLDEALADLNQEEKNKWLDFYGEMIDDRVEDGVTEQEAVEAIDLDDLVEQIMNQTGIEKKEEKPRREPWKWALIIGGAPLWLPVVVALAAVVLALLASVYAVEASFAGCAAGCVVLVPTYLGEGNIPGALFALGGALLCGGIAILLFRPILRLTKWVFRGFRRKESAK